MAVEDLGLDWLLRDCFQGKKYRCQSQQKSDGRRIFEECSVTIEISLQESAL